MPDPCRHPSLCSSSPGSCVTDPACQSSLSLPRAASHPTELPPVLSHTRASSVPRVCPRPSPLLPSCPPPPSRPTATFAVVLGLLGHTQAAVAGPQLFLPPLLSPGNQKPSALPSILSPLQASAPFSHLRLFQGIKIPWETGLFPPQETPGGRFPLSLQTAPSLSQVISFSHLAMPEHLGCPARNRGQIQPSPLPCSRMHGACREELTLPHGHHTWVSC